MRRVLSVSLIAAAAVWFFSGKPSAQQPNPSQAPSTAATIQAISVFDLRIALGTGARLDEIRNIDPDRDINWQDGTVHVIGKFRKERDIPMQPDSQAALAEQIEAEGRLWKQNPQRLREVLAQGAERAKMPRITPHALRHTFGTRWLQAGGDIYKLSKILGHSSVAVTEAHYAHLLKEDLIAASQQVKIAVAPRGNAHAVRMPRRHA